MEGERLTTSDRTLVPNRFVVHLNPDDLAGFGDMTTTLASELADAALAFAKAHRYTVVDRPQVDLVADPAIERTDIRVDARFADPIGGRDGTRSSRPRCRGRRRSSTATHTRVFQVPRPDGAARPPADHRSRRQDARHPDRTDRADDRAGHRQRPRRARPAGVAPPRPDHRAARDARLRRPRQHERVAGERHAGHRGRPRHRRSVEVGDTVLVVEVARTAELMDGFLLVLWAVRILFLPSSTCSWRG